MLTEPPEYAVDEALLGSPPSNNPYPGPVLSELQKIISTGGLALDVGSGRRSFGFHELVQMEICAYPHTDVINQSENLPFRDGSFDLVFSLAVTEHVRRPWVLASEMQRVVKKGGTIHVDSAFLQPIHGYPSHYFNMTHSALRALFNELEVVSLQPAPYQHPWYSINWILDHALADLPPDQKELLCAMTLEAILAELKRYCTNQSGVFAGISLPQHRIEELAAGFTLIGQKTASPAKADSRPTADTRSTSPAQADVCTTEGTTGASPTRADSRPTASTTAAEMLPEVIAPLAYPEANVLGRSRGFAHYWFWTKHHFREGGFKAVAKRARRRFGLAFHSGGTHLCALL